VRRLEVRHLAPLRIDQLVEDQEQPVGIDRAGVQVVVAVFGIVEMESAEAARMDQPRDDHLDVHIGRVMPEVDQAERLRAERLRGHQRAAPILNHRRIERRLVHFVLDQHAPIRRQRCIDLCSRFQIALERVRQVLLAREVGAVADPHGQRFRAKHFADANALDIVFDGLGAYGGIGMREAAVFVGKFLAGSILKRVRVDGIEAEPERYGTLTERRHVVRVIPRQVQ
jgi:hypothetical protein